MKGYNNIVITAAQLKTTPKYCSDAVSSITEVSIMFPTMFCCYVVSTSWILVADRQAGVQSSLYAMIKYCFSPSAAAHIVQTHRAKGSLILEGKGHKICVRPLLVFRSLAAFSSWLNVRVNVHGTQEHILHAKEGPLANGVELPATLCVIVCVHSDPAGTARSPRRLVDSKNKYAISDWSMSGSGCYFWEDSKLCQSMFHPFLSSFHTSIQSSIHPSLPFMQLNLM